MGKRSYGRSVDDDSEGEALPSGPGRRGRSPSKELQSIGGLFGGLKIAKSVKDHLRSIDLWARWHEIVGIELSRVTAPKEIKSKSLTITVAHQAWAHQLHFLTPSILNKIRSVCPEIAVRDLHFAVGTVKPVERMAASDSPRWWHSNKWHNKSGDGADSSLQKSAEGESAIALSERQEMTLRAVSDDRLRASIRKAMEASARYRL